MKVLKSLALVRAQTPFIQKCKNISSTSKIRLKVFYIIFFMFCSNYFLPNKAFSSGVSEGLIPADIRKVKFLLGGGLTISLSKLAAKLKTNKMTIHL